jgi:hypothetical protein
MCVAGDTAVSGGEVRCCVKLTGEFTSLEEPIDDSHIVIVAVFLANGSDFDGSERRI